MILLHSSTTENLHRGCIQARTCGSWKCNQGAVFAELATWQPRIGACSLCFELRTFILTTQHISLSLIFCPLFDLRSIVHPTKQSTTPLLTYRIAPFDTHTATLPLQRTAHLKMSTLSSPVTTTATTNNGHQSTLAAVHDWIAQGERSYQNGQYAHSEQTFQRAYHLYYPTITHDANTPDETLLTLHRHLGTTDHRLGRLPEAHEHLSRALEQARLLKTGPTLSLAHLLEELAAVCIDQQEYAQAKRYCSEALDMKRLVYGRHSSHDSNDNNNNTNEDGEHVHLPSANKMHLKQQMYGYDQASNSDVAHTLMQLGHCAFHLLRHHKARKFFQDALHMFQNEPGASVDAARALLSLGQVHAEMGRRLAARQFYEQALTLAVTTTDLEMTPTTTALPEKSSRSHALVAEIRQAMVDNDKGTD
jgi:tetratricopeptide (TPR) repeat protein